MATKLNWEYQDQSGEYHAEYKGIVIRAIRDDSPSNPFEDVDGHWPMLALPLERHSKITTYDEVPGYSLENPLLRFSDGALIHDQHAISRALDVDHAQLFDTKYCRDADHMRNLWEEMYAGMRDSMKFDALEALYKLLNIPVLNTTVHGYSQGDQTDLLIVATPEAQKELRSQPADMDDETWAKTLADDMEGQAKLYKAWAFGDVYGFQLARKVEDDDGDETLEDFEEIDASCWDFYGSEFDESGLEDAAIEAAEGFVKEKTDAAA